MTAISEVKQLLFYEKELTMSNEKFDLLGRLVALLTTISQAWGVLADLCEKLASSEGAKWLAELAKFLRKESTWQRFRRIASVLVAASENVVLTEELLRDEYNIGWLGPNFKRLLLGKTLEGVPAGQLAFYGLTECSTNRELKDEFGGKAVLPLVYMLSLIKKQRDGGIGQLLTNGYANLVLVKIDEDGKKTVWAVGACWGSGGRCWGVEAGSVEYPSRWDVGNQILSRDS